MVRQRDRDQMRDYLVAKLEGSSEDIRVKSKAIVGGEASDYILIGKDGAVILINRAYPEHSLRTLAQVFRSPPNAINNLAYVFFKDGKTFFRNAAHGEEAGLVGVRYKQTKDLSLKNYSSDEVNQMISLRPEELYVSRALGKFVQYYQPASEKLQEGFVSFKFEPVVFDYSHISSSERFGPVEKDSERKSIWRRKVEAIGCPLMLEGEYLKERVS